MFEDCFFGFVDPDFDYFDYFDFIGEEYVYEE